MVGRHPQVLGEEGLGHRRLSGRRTRSMESSRAAQGSWRARRRARRRSARRCRAAGRTRLATAPASSGSSPARRRSSSRSRAPAADAVRAAPGRALAVVTGLQLDLVRRRRLGEELGVVREPEAARLGPQRHESGDAHVSEGLVVPESLAVDGDGDELRTFLAGERRAPADSPDRRCRGADARSSRRARSGRRRRRRRDGAGNRRQRRDC